MFDAFKMIGTIWVAIILTNGLIAIGLIVTLRTFRLAKRDLAKMKEAAN